MSKLMASFPAATLTAISDLIKAIILAAVAFGLNWTENQIAAVMLVVFAASAVLTGGAITQRVTPWFPEEAAENPPLEG